MNFRICVAADVCSTFDLNYTLDCAQQVTPTTLATEVIYRNYEDVLTIPYTDLSNLHNVCKNGETETFTIEKSGADVSATAVDSATLSPNPTITTKSTIASGLYTVVHKWGDFSETHEIVVCKFARPAPPFSPVGIGNSYDHVMQSLTTSFEWTHEPGFSFWPTECAARTRLGSIRAGSQYDPWTSGTVTVD